MTPGLYDAKWGLAGLNIDGCRVASIYNVSEERFSKTGTGFWNAGTERAKEDGEQRHNPNGRWPANLILDEKAGAMLDEQSGVSKSSNHVRHNSMKNSIYNLGHKAIPLDGSTNDFGGASRFFYTAKASARERNEGLDKFAIKHLAESNKWTDVDYRKGNGEITAKGHRNNHPTVKPLSLMRYLITLIAPPQNALILDPFAGSGSTIVAAQELGIKAIGIEKEPEYAEIARARVAHTAQKVQKTINQMELFN